MDNLKPVGVDSKHSSSAVDSLAILHSVKKFWVDLVWKNKDDSRNVAMNIIGDICRFAIIYFENIAARGEKCDAMKSFGIFKVPIEICVVTHNINFIAEGIQKLSLDLTEGHSGDQNRQQNLIEKAVSHGQMRITRMLQTSIDKMISTIRKLLVEGADANLEKSIIGDRLLVYLDDCLLSLHDDLDKKDFTIAKEVLWATVLNALFDLIQKSLEVQRHPVFFSNLRTILNLLRGVFVDSLIERVNQIDHLLERYGLNTANLIHQYYKDRYQMQQEISKSPFNPLGVLSIYCSFFNNTLKLEILNARNLVPVGTNKKCDSFVKISVVPEDAFPKYQNFKTRVELDTHFPLYDEMFEL